MRDTCDNIRIYVVYGPKDSHLGIVTYNFTTLPFILPEISESLNEMYLLVSVELRNLPDGNRLLITPVSGLLEALQHYKKLATNDYFVIGLWDGIWDGSDPAQYFVGSLQVSRLYNV